jgi:transcriptional regulator with XRE-family HTH domain
MERTNGQQQVRPWLALRLGTGLSQREVERRMGWKRGHLSLIERGLPPSVEQARALRVFYLSDVAS